MKPGKTALSAIDLSQLQLHNSQDNTRTNSVVQLGFFTRGANRVLYRIVLLYGVCKHTQVRGVWGHAPKENF